MKYFLLLSLLSFSCFGSSDLSEGECIALPSSKKYIDFNTSTDYPKVYQFTCDFECLSSDLITKVTAHHNVKVFSISGEARDVVCHGVKVKKVSWGYDFDRVEKFFSYASGLSEISEWAKLEGLSLDHENSRYLMEKLIKDLNLVVESYRVAALSGAEGSKEFGIAVKIIETLLLELPVRTENLDNLMSQIKLTDLNTHTGLNLVLRILSSSAKWRLSSL